MVDWAYVHGGCDDCLFDGDLETTATTEQRMGKSNLFGNKICGKKKQGEYNMLRCHTEKGHKGECCFTPDIDE